MKATLLITGFLLSIRRASGFVPAPSTSLLVSTSSVSKCPTSVAAAKTDKMRHDILQELQDELGMEILHHLNKPKEGFGKEYMETFDHKLRRLREDLKKRDLKYQREIQKLREEIHAYKVAYEMEQTIVEEDEAMIEDYQEENESVRRLVWQAVKLIGSRLWKLPTRLYNAILVIDTDEDTRKKILTL